MKKKLFITSALLLSSILTMSGCASTSSSDTSSAGTSSSQTSGSSSSSEGSSSSSSSSSEVKVNAKKELKEVLKASDEKLEEEIKKDTFKLTVNGSEEASVKGSVSNYSNTTVYKINEDGTKETESEIQSEKVAISLNEKATSTQKVILSLDGAYYRSLGTETPKATNDSYAYAEANATTTLSSVFQGSAPKEIKAQAILKDGEGYLYTKQVPYEGDALENGLPFEYSSVDSYINVGLSYLDGFLAQEGVTNRLNYIKASIKALLPEDDEGTAVIVDKVFAVINDLYTYASVGGDLNLDSALDLFETLTGTTTLDEETKVFIKKTVNALLKVFDLDKVITYEKVNDTYKMNVDYKALLSQVKLALTTLKTLITVQFANNEEVLAQVNEIYTMVNGAIDTYAPTNVDEVVTFTVKDGLLTGVEEELKLEGLTVNEFVIGGSIDIEGDTYTDETYLVDVSISELTLKTKYSFSYEALSKDELPEVTKITTEVTPA